MWFLKVDTLIIISLFVLIILVARIFTKNKFIPYIMPILDIIFIGIISLKLLLWITLYSAMGYLASKLILRFGKKWIFILMFGIALVPFFIAKFSLFDAVVTIGTSYHLLRIIDCFYHVYYGKEDLKFLAYVNYIFFLPVFTAGPIFRYRDFVKTFENPEKITIELVEKSIKRIIRGFFKKVVLIVFAMKFFDYCRSLDSHWYISIFIVSFGYIIMYLDLSGYSDIAIGMGSICGYKIPENFKKPWNSATMTQFWRTWHSSLSDWIKDHIFIVFGKKKLSKYNGAIIGLVAMIVMSMWHGFNWGFLIAGTYNGILLALENIFGITTVNRRKTNKYIYRFRTIVVNFLFAINTLIFMMPLEELLRVVSGLVKW